MAGKMRRPFSWALLVAALAPLGLSGCLYPFSGISGNFPGLFPFGLATPIPVMPWVSTVIEERYQHKNDFRTPILPPIRPGFPEPLCEDPPDDAQVLRALIPVVRGIPYIYEEFRDNIQVVTERIVDRIDPPRFFPLIGWARLHHCHYKCTVYYTGTYQSDYPFPFKVVKPRVKVVYIDKDHFHLEPGGTPEVQQGITRDLAGF
jgi:hypothetical protein